MMKFSQFEHLGAEGQFYSDLAEVIERHTGASGDQAAWWAERLISHGIMNGFRVYSRSKDIEALQRLEKAFRQIDIILSDDSPLSEPAHLRLFMEIWHDDGRDAYSALLTISENGRKLKSAIKRTISEIEISPKAKASASKINERGIAMVDAARFIWKLATDVDAPAKDLNPASRFGAFLADIFDVCEIPGDPRSAFRAWVRERGDWSLDRPE